VNCVHGKPAFADCEGVVAEFRIARILDNAHYPLVTVVRESTFQSHHEGTKDTKRHEEEQKRMQEEWMSVSDLMRISAAAVSMDNN